MRNRRDGNRCEAQTRIVLVAVCSNNHAVLSEFFRRLGPSGAAYVILSDSASSSAALMRALLSPTSGGRRAVTPTDEQVLQSDTFYVAPRHRAFTLRDGCFAYTGSAPPQPHLLERLAGLASDPGVPVACVLISGASRGGANALERVQRAGALALHLLAPSVDEAAGAREGATDEATARERRAISWTLAHVTEALGAWSTRDTGASAADPRLEAIRERLDAAYEIDLAMHKEGVLTAQVAARAKRRSISGLDQYAALLDGSREELALLHDAVLVGTTRFFRDEAVFEALARRVFANLMQAESSRPLRFWVPACSTGEEAYSLAILLQELLDARGERRDYRIYATDVRENAVAFARRGVYSSRVVEELSPARLERWFVARDKGYEVVRALRERIIWGRHNVLTDPPFLRLDLISCRNLLVYLHREAQALALAKFHFALRADGALLLGSAESTMAAGRSFEVIDYASRLFKKRAIRAAHADGSQGEHPPARGMERHQ